MPAGTLTCVIVIVGAGAAGIFAAWRAAQRGHQVLLLEKTSRIGTKILISGGGKCNICHAGPIEEVLRAFRKNEAVFLRPSMYRFTNEQVVDLFTSRGLEVYTRPNGRIFPVDKTAKDVVAILSRVLQDAGVTVRLDAPVSSLIIRDGQCHGVRMADGTEIEAQAVVLTVGGKSYPNSGTTGDGYPWVRAAGHTLVPIKAALAPMRTDPCWPEISGVSLRDCVLKARAGGKELMRWRDDLLLTHRGISGPTVLGISRECAEVDPGAQLFVDCRPDDSYESVTEELRRWCQVHPKRTIRRWLEGTVAASVMPLLLSSAGINGDTLAMDVPKKERNRLVEVVKNWNMAGVAEVVLDKGEVVAGGVALGEVDPHSMRSLKCGNLFLAGEILDVAGPVGGYNLQAAFSTGWVAGDSV